MEEIKKTQEFEFKAEMKQLLNLIVHSLYTHPEVFLRELISNSSDALNKLRFKKLTESNILDADEKLKITISLDKDNSIFSIEDNGIGMSKDELINQIGTVASSGTLAFLKKVNEAKQNKLDANFIGQFGVGFYSVFMVTDEVTIETRNYEIDSIAYRWKSSGQNSYTIEEIDKPNRGTKISFKLKDEFKDFAEDWKVKSIINKYSNFVDFPIYIADQELNKVNALWQKKKEDISEDELNEFYKYISNDYDNPLGHLVLNIEGNINFKSIIFIPKNAPQSLFTDTREKTLQLYTNRVFIQDDAKELLPEYLRFVKGVIDTEDLPLNVSRELTQSSPAMTKIKNIITGKILGLLEEWAEKDQDKYIEFFKNFSTLFKTGLNSDFANQARIVELMRYESTNTNPGEFTSLAGYLSRMKADQKEIYYLSGQTRELVEKNPNLEYFKKEDIEVLLLTDPADIFTIPYLRDYKEKPIKSIDKADIDFSNKKSDSTKIEEELKISVINKFKEILGDKVEDVVESSRLVDSPVTLVVGKTGLDAQMEKMLQMMDKNFSGSKRILEVNTNHKLIENIARLIEKNNDSDLIDSSINQLYEGALLIEGYMKDPISFISRMNEFMTKATEIN